MGKLMPACRSIRRSGTDLAFAGTTAFGFGGYGGHRRVRLRRLLASLDRGAVARDMPDQPIRLGFLDQRRVQPGGQGARGERREGARERGFAGDLAQTLPAAQPAQGLVGRQRIDQQAGGRKVEHGFGDEGARQGGAFGKRAPRHALPAGHQRLDPRHAQHADQLLVVSAQRSAHRVVKPGKKIFLNAEQV